MTLSRSNGQSILLRIGESVKFGMGGKFFLRKRRHLWKETEILIDKGFQIIEDKKSL